MANPLDELNPVIREEGLETNVIAKKLPVTVGIESTLFEIFLWVCGIVPGIIFAFMKINAKKRFEQLEQKIQRYASQIDNFLEQRVIVLQNCARLLDRAIDLDKDVFTTISAHRSGATEDADERRIALDGEIDGLARSISLTVESYPELAAHKAIEEAMQQNMYLQREITAARELYNDAIDEWNREIFEWPTKKIVAAKNGYTTRIPFIASREIKEKANDVFF